MRIKVGKAQSEDRLELEFVPGSGVDLTLSDDPSGIAKLAIAAATQSAGTGSLAVVNAADVSYAGGAVAGQDATAALTAAAATNANIYLPGVPSGTAYLVTPTATGGVLLGSGAITQTLRGDGPGKTVLKSISNSAGNTAILGCVAGSTVYIKDLEIQGPASWASPAAVVKAIFGNGPAMVVMDNVVVNGCSYGYHGTPTVGIMRHCLIDGKNQGVSQDQCQGLQVSDDNGGLWILDDVKFQGMGSSTAGSAGNPSHNFYTFFSVSYIVNNCRFEPVLQGNNFTPHNGAVPTNTPLCLVSNTTIRHTHTSTTAMLLNRYGRNLVSNVTIDAPEGLYPNGGSGQLSNVTWLNTSGSAAGVGLDQQNGGLGSQVTVANSTFDRATSGAFDVQITDAGSQFTFDNVAFKSPATAASITCSSTSATGLLQVVGGCRFLNAQNADAIRTKGLPLQVDANQFAHAGKAINLVSGGTATRVALTNNQFDQVGVTYTDTVAAANLYTAGNYGVRVEAEQAANIASAATIQVPATGALFTVSGTTNISSISTTRAWRDRRIVLKFLAGLTVNSGTNLTLVGSFPTVAGATLTLFFDGTNWVEAARTPNSAPANSAAPQVGGGETVGTPELCDRGHWSNTPYDYAYAWYRVDGTGARTSLNADNFFYAPTGTDVGFFLQCDVTATNTTGSTTVSSNLSAAVVAASSQVTVPANTGAPAITGSATQGSTLTCSSGTWTGNPAPTFAYQWKRADDAAFTTNITNIGTGTTYVLTASENNKYVRCVVTGSNSAGSATANSNIVAPVAASGYQQNDWSVTTGNSISRGYAASYPTGAGPFPLIFLFHQSNSSIATNNTPGTATDWAYAHQMRTDCGAETFGQANNVILVYGAGETRAKGSAWGDWFYSTNTSQYFGKINSGSNSLTVWTDQAGTTAATTGWATNDWGVIAPVKNGCGVDGAKKFFKVSGVSSNTLTITNLDGSAFSADITAITSANGDVEVRHADSPDHIYVTDVIADLNSRGVNVDATKVYGMGLSAGASFLTRMAGDPSWAAWIATFRGIVEGSTAVVHAPSASLMPDSTVYTPANQSGYQPWVFPSSPRLTHAIMHAVNDGTVSYTGSSVGPPPTPTIYTMASESYRDALVTANGCTNAINTTLGTNYTITGSNRAGSGPGGVRHYKATVGGHAAGLFSSGALGGTTVTALWNDLYTHLSGH